MRRGARYVRGQCSARGGGEKHTVWFSSNKKKALRAEKKWEAPVGEEEKGK